MPCGLYLGGDLLLRCNDHAIFGKDADGSSRVGDRFHRVFHLVESAFWTEYGRSAIISAGHGALSITCLLPRTQLPPTEVQKIC